MAHAEHFLSRLSRVDDAEVELAMRLYRDPELVSFVLGRAPLPEGAERVALSLGDVKLGPFVIVTRGGAFVTCIGAGMKHDLPVISRERLQSSVAQREEQQLRLEIAGAVEARAGGRQKMWRAAQRHHPPLSREEFVGISAFEALLFDDHVRILVEDGVNNGLALGGLIGTGARAGAMRPIIELSAGMVESTGNLAVLTAAFARDSWVDLMNEVKIPGHRTVVSTMQFFTGHLGCAAKGLWALNRIGKPMLDELERDYARCDTAIQLCETALGLVILALGHEKVRKRALDALAKDPPFLAHPSEEKTWRPFLELVRAVPDHLPHHDLILLGSGRGLAFQGQRGGRRYARPEDVPDDVARAAVLTAPFPFLEHGAMQLLLMSALPWLARAPPEDLYLREEDRDAVVAPFDPEAFLGLARAHRKWLNTSPTVVREGPKTGRNDPCPCGSGKKFKKCCAK